MKILLSINPEHVINIFLKTKQYEFRKVRCKQDVNMIVIYATAPVSRVIGEVEVLDILEDKPDKIWEITKRISGITRELFAEYYENKERAVAYKLGKVKKYKEPKLLNEIGINYTPQSFVYLR